jgi:outer membrane receptor protein involved in Fe transport
MSAAQLERVAIDRIEDLQLHVPNLNLTETGISTQMYVRGIGSGNNQGFEQSVVQFIDGVSYARQQLSRAPFFDMERAEVLRGPQSILFGKNAIGGALNFTTAAVEEDNTGRIFVQTGEHGIMEVQGVANAELIDSKLYGRLSLRRYEEDGYVENTLLGVDEPNREDQTVRLKLKYLINDDWTANFKYESNEFDTLGRQIEIIQDVGNPGNAFGVTLGGGFGLTQAIPEANLDYKRTANGDTSFNESDALVLEIKGMLGDLEFESRTASLEYSYNEICDCDFIGANIFTLPMDEEYEQISQEFRIASDPNQAVSWQAGLFYQSSELVFMDNLTLPTADIGRPDLGVLPTAVFALQAPAVGPDAAAVQGSSLSGVGALRHFTQDTDALSAFGQVTFKLSDATQMTFGARWSTEDKDGSRSINIIDNATGIATTNPATPLVLLSLFNVQSVQSAPGSFTTARGAHDPHDLSGDHSETAVDPSVNFQHYLNDDVMVYAGVSKGSKAGGFDARANLISSFEYGDEEATAIEVGAKNTFWDNRAKLNIALYMTEYEGLQVSQFDGTLGFVVGNADADMSGVEIDGSIAVTEDFTISYAAAYLHHEFKDYKNGNCYYLQGSDDDNPSLRDRFNPATGLCDYTGLTGQYAPELTANVNFDYYVDVFSDAQLHFNLNYNYLGTQQTHQNLDPVFLQPATGRVDLNVALEFENWGVEVLGRNITDEEYVTYSGNSPLSGTFGSDTVYGFIASPAVWTLRAYYNF